MTAHIRQIFYSDATRQKLDPGFIPLDNLANLRPDWREYGPIRAWLQGNVLNENDHYGFFSPKFRDKTGLDSSAVQAFISQTVEPPDVFLFSPFFDQSAFWLNVFIQFHVHKDGNEVMRESTRLITPGLEGLTDTVLMDSRNTVFCNYFVARPRFWRLWLEKSELLYALAEADNTPLARLLNAEVIHDGQSAPTKVFVIERVASWLLVTHQFRTRAYDPWLLPHSNSSVAKYRSELVQMDALKIALGTQGYNAYFEEYERLRIHVTALAKKDMQALGHPKQGAAIQAKKSPAGATRWPIRSKR
jgi:hypothetical protein